MTDECFILRLQITKKAIPEKVFFSATHGRQYVDNFTF